MTGVSGLRGRPSRSSRRGARGAFALVLWLAAVALGSTFAVGADAQGVDYQRPVDSAPTEEVIGEGYVTPTVQRPRPLPPWRQVLDLSLLGLALLVGAWLVHERRSRRGLVALTVVSVAYFGFVREGCICPIGSIQNVSLALVDPEFAVPYFVIGLFLLPLLAALFFGRVFCSGVCPLGAAQELMLVRPVRVPPALDRTLRWIPWVYLSLAVGLAIAPLASRDFVICRYDPFVGFFRFSGSLGMILLGVGVLVLAMFVGRPYCRWLCPYAPLLALCSRLSSRPVSITPGRELDCGLCHASCPYGAIENLRASRGDCLACARCYRSCPVDRTWRNAGTPQDAAGRGERPPTEVAA